MFSCACSCSLRPEDCTDNVFARFVAFVEQYVMADVDSVEEPTNVYQLPSKISVPFPARVT